MVIQITNTCTANCRHCMQSSSPEPQHMTQGVFDEALILGSVMMHCRTLILGGGEPTLHPDWIKMVQQACRERFGEVVLATNGNWLTDPAMCDTMFDLLKDNHKFKLQITAINKFYTNAQAVKNAAEPFKLRLKEAKLKHRLYLFDGNLHLISHGRMLDCPDLLEEAREDMTITASCVMGAVTAIQTDLLRAIQILEGRGKFCHPFVDWKGNMHWGEVWTCPPFANVFDDWKDIQRKAKEWRPCKNCADWKKLEQHVMFEQMGVCEHPKYTIAKAILESPPDAGFAFAEVKKKG